MNYNKFFDIDVEKVKKEANAISRETKGVERNLVLKYNK